MANNGYDCVCVSCGRDIPNTSHIGGGRLYCPCCSTIVDTKPKEPIKESKDPVARWRQRIFSDMAIARLNNEAIALGCEPPPCPTCGEMLWDIVGISPNKQSATWKCGYCNKRTIIRVAKVVTSRDLRKPIPKAVRLEVWERDKGQCIECGSKEKLEYDHLIPLSKNGGNTARNLQLLCEACNRRKSDRIG